VDVQHYENMEIPKECLTVAK